MFSDAELFGSRVSMVEFQGGAAGPIAAVLTFASPESDEPLFPLSPPLPEISHPRVRASPLTECIGVVARTGRLLGRVVLTERRALQTELSSIQGSHYSIDA